MTDKILKNQSLGVDAITGASLSSMSLKAAVGACIEKAGGDLKACRKTSKTRNGPVTLQGDVVVIGGGGAGLAAAISANKTAPRS